MGLDMYLERRRLISSNYEQGGSSYDVKHNPLIRTVEITSVGYWRKKYELDNYISEIAQEAEYSNCVDIYIDETMCENIVNKAKDRIKELTQEIANLQKRLEDKRLSPNSKLTYDIKCKIGDAEWELNGWEDAKEVFQKAYEDYNQNYKTVDYYFHRWW